MCLFFRQGKVRKPNNRYKHQKQHVHRAWNRKFGDRKWACSFQVYSLRENLHIKFYPSLILDYSVFFYCSFRPLLLLLVFIPRFATFVNSTKRFPARIGFCVRCHSQLLPYTCHTHPRVIYHYT